MKYPELIFLWGMPGSGKSTLGKKLANHLSYSWIDTDVSIEKSEGKTIEQIFNEEGEEKFRTLEENCLDELLSLKQTVISCGGGFPVFNNNATKMLEAGFCIYLDANLELLCQRILEGKDQRPLFSGVNLEKINDNLRNLFQKRQFIYELAHCKIKIPVKSSKAFILQVLEGFASKENNS